MAKGQGPFKSKKKAPVPTTVTVTGASEGFIGDPGTPWSAVVIDQYGAVMPSSAYTITWASSDPAIATVDAAGKVTAVTEGDVIIEANAV
jgi:predicted transcriptional regulator